MSSNIIGGIKAVLLFFFFYEKTSHAQKAHKRTKKDSIFMHLKNI